MAYVFVSVAPPIMSAGIPAAFANAPRLACNASISAVSTGVNVNGWNSVVAFSTAIDWLTPPCWAIHRAFNVSAWSWVRFGVFVFR